MHKEPRSARGQILRGRRFVDGRERREERAAAVAVGDVERAGRRLGGEALGARTQTRRLTSGGRRSMQRPAIPSHLKTRTGPGSVSGTGKRTIFKLMRLAFARCEKA